MQEYPTCQVKEMINKTRQSEMEKGIIDLLKGGNAVMIPDRDIDMRVFAEYPKGKEGIAVYYPLFRDGSCAEAVYIKFYRSAVGMSMEIACVREYSNREKERLGTLLRQ